ncbi:hypothetical protein J6590_041257 [Homalodisca vitripennis]|nr:hypothetical protein J6590_041257 [Homalodisca vitripennis]
MVVAGKFWLGRGPASVGTVKIGDLVYSGNLPNCGEAAEVKRAINVPIGGKRAKFDSQITPL